MNPGGEMLTGLRDASRAARRTTTGTTVFVLAVAAAAWWPHRHSIGDSESSTDVSTLRLDPNVATREELILLPRIGPKLAEAIIAFRASSPNTPAFACADDLQAV